MCDQRAIARMDPYYRRRWRLCVGKPLACKARKTRAMRSRTVVVLLFSADVAELDLKETSY